MQPIDTQSIMLIQPHASTLCKKLADRVKSD